MPANISFGSKLGLLNNAAIGETYYDELRPFLRGIDALVQASVVAAASTPPGSPNDGDAYIIFGGSGLWAGKSNQIAVWAAQATTTGTDTLVPAWDYYTPKAGWTVWLPSVGFVYFDGTGWVSPLSQTNEILISNPIGNQLIFQPVGTQFSVTGLTAGTGSGSLTVFQDTTSIAGRLTFPAISSTITANTTIGTDDTTNLGSVYTIDATANNVTITLPLVVGTSNGSTPMYCFVRNDVTPSAFTVTIQGSGSDKISGQSNTTLNNFDAVVLVQPAPGTGDFLGGWLILDAHSGYVLTNPPGNQTVNIPDSDSFTFLNSGAGGAVYITNNALIKSGGATVFTGVANFVVGSTSTANITGGTGVNITATANNVTVGAGTDVDITANGGAVNISGSTSIGLLTTGGSGSNIVINDNGGHNSSIIFGHDSEIEMGTNSIINTSGGLTVQATALSNGLNTFTSSATVGGTRMTFDATSGAITATLPAANSVPAGTFYTMKKIDSSGNAVTVTAAGSDKIDGSATYALSAQYKFVKIFSDGTSKWYIEGSN